ncbi:MAG: cache domain-containing protein, partial [Nitrospiria bacterium]
MIKLKTKIGLRTKVVLAMLIVGSIPVILGLILTSFQGTNQLRGAIGTNFEGLAKEAAHKTDLAVTREVTEVDHLATVSTEIRESVKQANQVYAGLSEAALAKRLDEASQNWKLEQEGLVQGALIASKASKYLRDSLKISKREGVYIAVYVTDRKGALVASVNRYPDYLHSQADWWKKTYHQGRGRPYLGDLYYDEKAKTHAFDIAIPIMDEERIEVLGVVKEVIDLQAFLKPSIHEIRFGKTGHAMLVDSDGRVIICPVLPTGLILPDKELVRTITSSQPGWFTARDDGHGGKNSIVGFDPVEQVNLLIAGAGGKKWHSFIRQDPKELYTPIKSLLFSVSVAASFSVGLLVLMGFYISKKMVQPIHILHEGAELIGKGNLEHRLKVETKDELEQLANEFNTMAEKLQQSYSTLEQKVGDRTKEISALYMIATTLNQSLDLHEILEETLKKVLEAMKQEAGMIRFWEEDKGKLVLKAHKGLSEELCRAEVETDMGDTISGKVALIREPIFLDDVKGTGNMNSP